jgi:membrane protease YdiL (CAAX protease family)
MSDRNLPRYAAVLLALGFVALSLAGKLLPWFALAFLGERSIVRSSVAGVVALAAAVGLTAALQRWRPGATAPDLLLLPRPSWGGLGLAGEAAGLGLAMFALTYGVARVTGGIQVEWGGMEPVTLAGTLAAMLLATVLNAAWEELTFRGWPFSACVQAIGPHPVAIGIGTLFGLAHLLNPNWSPAAILSVSIAGWLIGYAMLASGNILFPIGLHVGWNMTQSVLTSRRLWVVHASANALLSGGEYGLEASAAGIAVTAVAAALGLVVFLRRRRPSRAEREGPGSL